MNWEITCLLLTNFFSRIVLAHLHRISRHMTLFLFADMAFHLQVTDNINYSPILISEYKATIWVWCALIQTI